MTEKPNARGIKSDVPSGLPEEPRSPQFIETATKLKEDFYHITIEDLEDVNKLATDPNIEQVFLDDLHRTVAEHDDHVSKANFHTGISMYHVPVNNTIKAESGAGKTYGATEVVSYLPDENVIIIGSQSPKVVSHDYGELMTGDDEPLNLEDAPIKPYRRDYEGKDEFLEAIETYKKKKLEWNEKLKHSYYLIRLSNTTLVFLDTISHETFEMFKSTLSHDKPRITHRYVDDKGKVHTTVLEGWPSAIFCSTDKKWIAEFSTRTFTVSPSTSKEKISKAMQITSQKNSYPWEYEQDTNVKIRIKTLIRNIRDVFKQYNLKVLIPFPHLEELFSKIAVRDMRDYNHFTEILPAYTMLKTFQRPMVTIKNKKYLVATLEDAKEAKELFDKIAETTRTGTEQTIIDFYEIFVKSKINGVTLKTLVNEYNEENKDNTRSGDALRLWLKRLDLIGWVDIRKGDDPTDKRKDTFYPLKGIENPQQKLYETSGKNDIQLDLTRKLQLDFKTWLETICGKGIVTQYENCAFYKHELSEISIEDFVKKVTGIDLNILQIVSEEYSEPKPEIELKSSGIEENQPVSLNLEDLLSKTLGVVQLTSDTIDNCALCGLNGRMDWQVTLFGGSWKLLCGPCGDKVSEKLRERGAS